MREKWPKQMPLMSHILDHSQSKELEVISGIIDANPTICEHILQDLNRGKSEAQRAGAKGMSAEQVLRCIVVKILFGFTYEELAFHIVDSQSLRWFCRIGITEEGFRKSALNRNIKAISAQTWEMINRDILDYAKQEGIEKGRKVRTDCTCVESNVHRPWDSILLGDCVRHTDVIVKDRRDPIYGHKICLTGGVSNLILDCLVVEGNPADVDLAIPMLDRQKEIYGRYPLKVCFDGGFTSKANLKQAKAAPRNIKDVCFAKKRGLEETDMCRSEYVYHRLRRFRAGIESGISWLKRSMGLARCMLSDGH